jgi:hypothetical protein
MAHSLTTHGSRVGNTSSFASCSESPGSIPSGDLLSWLVRSSFLASFSPGNTRKAPSYSPWLPASKFTRIHDSWPFFELIWGITSTDERASLNKSWPPVTQPLQLPLYIQHSFVQLVYARKGLRSNERGFRYMTLRKVLNIHSFPFVCWFNYAFNSNHCIAYSTNFGPSI